MDRRFSELPASARTAMRSAGRVLDAAQRTLAAKKRIATLAARRGQAAGQRARVLQDKMQ